MPRITALSPFAVSLVVTVMLAFAPSAVAQRRIIGSDSDQVTDAGPAPPPPRAEAKAPVKAKKKPAEEKKPVDDKRDVLKDTPAEKVTKSKETEAKEAAGKAAESAADAAAKKKQEDLKRLADEQRAADAKKKLENKDQRLAAAKKLRQLTRSSGPFALSVALEPGHVQKDALLEVRLDIAQKLDVPDPRYGNLLPIKGAKLVATVTSGKGKQRYALHALDTPGRYGWHTTPNTDGPMSVQISGTTSEGQNLDATFAVHVGVWPPPDFEPEEKNNLATDASRGGRKLVGGDP